MTLPLKINIFERGLGGVTSTTLLAELSGRASSYNHSITDQFGFESMQVAMTVSLAEAIDWLSNGLMRSAIVANPFGKTVWEGALTTISAQIDQKPVALSLEAMANRVRCVYTDVLGMPGTTSSVSNAASQSIYGIKDRVVSLAQSGSGPAGYRAAIVLSDVAYPKSRQATQAMTGHQGDITLTLSFMGWYGTLEWLVTSNSTTSTAVTTTQVGTLIGNYAAVNAFLSTSTALITASGISSSQLIAAQTTYREAIEDRLKLGDGTNPLAWGVYENKTFHVDPWAGATPASVAYFEHPGDANVYDLYNNVVPPWDVRPNAMSQVTDLLDVSPPSGASDASGRKYVGRVTCSISGDQIGCTLEPSAMDSIETRLAALR